MILFDVPWLSAISRYAYSERERERAVMDFSKDKTGKNSDEIREMGIIRE